MSKKNPTQLVSYRIPVKLFRELKALSRKSGQSMSAIAAESLRKAVIQGGKK